MQDITLKIIIDKSNAIQAIPQIKKSIDDLRQNVEKPMGLFLPSGEFKKFNDEIKTSTDNSQKHREEQQKTTTVFGQLGERLIGINQGLQLTAQLFTQFWGAINSAAELDVLRENFRGTTEDLELFRKASAGTVTEAGLIKLSNQATDLGLSLKDQALLFSLAEDAGDKYGGNLESNFQKIVFATEGNTKGLKSLGIEKVKYENIVKELAQVQGDELNNLDAETQKQIRLQAILRASGQTIEDVKNKIPESKDSLDQITVSMTELVDSLASSFLPIITTVGGALKALFDLFGSFPVWLKTVAAGVIVTASAFFLLNSSFGPIPYILIGIITGITALIQIIRDGNPILISLAAALGGVSIALILLNAKALLVSFTLGATMIPALVKFGAAVRTIVMANPWLLLAVAITSVTAALLASRDTASDLAQANVDLAKSNKDVIDKNIELAEKNKSLEESNLSLLNQYKELASKVNKTAEEKRRLSEITAELNDKYPGLIQDGYSLKESISVVGSQAKNTTAQIKTYSDELNRLAETQKQALITLAKSEMILSKEKLTDTIVDNNAGVGSKVAESLGFNSKARREAEALVNMYYKKINEAKSSSDLQGVRENFNSVVSVKLNNSVWDEKTYANATVAFNDLILKAETYLDLQKEITVTIDKQNNKTKTLGDKEKTQKSEIKQLSEIDKQLKALKKKYENLYSSNATINELAKVQAEINALTNKKNKIDLEIEFKAQTLGKDLSLSTDSGNIKPTEKTPGKTNIPSELSLTGYENSYAAMEQRISNLRDIFRNATNEKDREAAREQLLIAQTKFNNLMAAEEYYNQQRARISSISTEAIKSGFSSLWNSFAIGNRQAKNEFDAAWLAIKGSALSAIGEILMAEISAAITGTAVHTAAETTRTGVTETNAVIRVATTVWEGISKVAVWASETASFIAKEIAMTAIATAQGAIRIAVTIAEAAAQMMTSVVKAVASLVEELGWIGLIAGAGAIALGVALWGSIKQAFGFEQGGRLKKGQTGYFEGYENEIIAPEKTFIQVFKQDLLPQLIGKVSNYELAGLRPAYTQPQINIDLSDLRRDLNKHLTRVEKWQTNLQFKLKSGDLTTAVNSENAFRKRVGQ